MATTVTDPSLEPASEVSAGSPSPAPDQGTHRRDEQLFDPVQIRAAMSQFGFVLTDASQTPLPIEPKEPDVELWLVERVMRIFLRANQVNEDVIRMKLGIKAPQFLDEVLPRLLDAGMLEVIPYLGSGSQRRFKMRVHMQTFHDALAKCSGDFQKFLAYVQTADGGKTRA